jgi:hypothetical protein
MVDAAGRVIFTFDAYPHGAPYKTRGGADRARARFAATDTDATFAVTVVDVVEVTP